MQRRLERAGASGEGASLRALQRQEPEAQRAVQQSRARAAGRRAPLEPRAVVGAVCTSRIQLTQYLESALGFKP
jgi:hypothetical protein